MTDMGRHESDPVPFRDYLRKPIPFLERTESETTEMEAVPAPAEELKRRSWPMALGLTLAVLAAVGIPVGVSRMASDPAPIDPAPVFTADHSASPDPEAEPVPTVTKTKKLIEYKPTPGPTIFRISPGPTITKNVPVPVPTVTVTKTMRPEPRPTRTIRLEVCIGIELETGDTIGEIKCPT